VSLLSEVEKCNWSAFEQKLKPLTSKIDRLEQIGSVSQSSVWKVNLTYGILFLSTSSGPFAVKEVQTFHRDEKKLRREIALLWFLSNTPFCDYFVKFIGWKMEKKNSVHCNGIS